jgi:hypothetical protein
MSSLEAALYNYSLEESWDARLRKWKSASAEQITEQRTRVRDIRDRLLHLIQDADEDGDRDQASVTSYSFLLSHDRLLAARQQQRERRKLPDTALTVERELLATLVQVLEPHVPAARRLAIEAYLVGQAPPTLEVVDEATGETPHESVSVDEAQLQVLIDERDRLASRIEALEEARRRLEVELGTYDPLAIIELVRKTRDRLNEAERLLSPLALERDALSREFGTFTAVQIIGQVRLLKDKNGELNQQLRFARSRPAVAVVPTAPETDEALEKLVGALEEALGIAPEEALEEALEPLAKAA